MKFTDLKVGEYYHLKSTVTRSSGINFLFNIKSINTTNNSFNVDHCIEEETNFTTGMFSFDPDFHSIRLMNQQEVAWFIQCVKDNKILPLEQFNNNYEIY